MCLAQRFPQVPHPAQPTQAAVATDHPDRRAHRSPNSSVDQLSHRHRRLVRMRSSERGQQPDARDNANPPTPKPTISKGNIAKIV